MGMCDAPGCTKKKLYAPAFGQPARYCGGHAPLDWVDVLRKRCEQDGCLKGPTHGYLGGNRQCCKTHGAERGMVDVAHKRCEVNGCPKQPSFAPRLPGAKPQRCDDHQLPDDVNIAKSNFLCQGVNNGGCPQPNPPQANFAPTVAKTPTLCASCAAVAAGEGEPWVNVFVRLG